MKLRTRRAKEIVMALSLSNLIFLEEWATLLKPYNHYFQNESLIPLLLVMFNVLLFAAVFFVGLTLARYSRRAWVIKFARLVFLGTFIIPLNYFRISLGLDVHELIAQYGWLLFVAVFVFSAFAVFVIYRWRSQVVRIAAGIILIFSPFVLFTFSQAAWLFIDNEVITPQEIFVEPVYVEEDPAIRVLWLIFDKMDQNIAFAERPQALELPELDRLRDQSLYVTNAYSPANNTKISIPSLLTGRQINESKPINSSELLITLKAGEIVKLSDQPNIFSQALDAGYNSAVAGRIYHPYCRLFRDSIIMCSRQVPREDVVEYSFDKTIKTSVQQIYSLQPWWARLPEWLNKPFVFEGSSRVEVLQRTLENSKKFAEDPALGLIFVHFMVPHPPCINSWPEMNFVSRRDSADCYLNNLVVADIVLGELRVAMENAGTWENTAIVLSSDHGEFQADKSDNEKNGLAVPFLLKLPNQKEKVVYEHSFNTILTHDLILELLNGTTLDLQGVVNWLDQRRSDI